jgi:hypothetical protein
MPSDKPVVARVGSWSRTLGSQRIVNALGASIAYRLEPQADAQRFPALLVDLWRGRLPASKADAALAELEVVQRELAALPASKAVWSVSDLRRIDDTQLPVNHAAASLADYFVAPDGRPLLAVIREAVQQAMVAGETLTVGTWARTQGWKRGTAITALGLAGAAVTYALFPDAVVTEGHDQGTVHHGLLVWVLFLMIASVGVWELAETALPGLAAWRRERAFFAGFLRAVFLIGLLWLGWR